MAGQRSWQSRHFLRQENTWADDDENAIAIQNALAAQTFPAAALPLLLGCLRQMGLLRNRERSGGGEMGARLLQGRASSAAGSGGTCPQTASWGWATQVLAALAPRTELVGRARPFLHRSALHRLLLGLRRLCQEPRCHHASRCKHLSPAIGQHKCKDHRCSTINIANFLPLQTVSSPTFSLQEKFYHAENSHSKVICKSTEQIVHRASKIIRREGYAQSLKCQMLL